MKFEGMQLYLKDAIFDRDKFITDGWQPFDIAPNVLTISHGNCEISLVNRPTISGYMELTVRHIDDTDKIAIRKGEATPTPLEDLLNTMHWIAEYFR